MTNDLVERITVRVYLACLSDGIEFRAVAANRLELALELVGDVHNEGWAQAILSIRDAVDDFPRAMLRQVGLHLGQPRDEARISHELRRHPVIRVPALRRG